MNYAEPLIPDVIEHDVYVEGYLEWFQREIIGKNVHIDEIHCTEEMHVRIARVIAKYHPNARERMASQFKTIGDFIEHSRDPRCFYGGYRVRPSRTMAGVMIAAELAAVIDGKVTITIGDGNLDAKGVSLNLPLPS